MKRYDSIREAIQEQAEATGLSLRKLAELAGGVGKSQLAEYLSGKGDITTERADRLLAALGIRVVK